MIKEISIRNLIVLKFHRVNRTKLICPKRILCMINLNNCLILQIWLLKVNKQNKILLVE